MNEPLRGLARKAAGIRPRLEAWYRRYHKPECIGSDPLAFVLRFEKPADQEIVGLLASSLAYGNVTTIHTSVERVLARMKHVPRDFLVNSRPASLRRAMAGFRHRWTGEEALVSLLAGMRQVILDHGSLGSAFRAVDAPEQELNATLSNWVRLLWQKQPPLRKDLLSDPERNSACKRLHLYLRWMVRKDAVDPGCWSGIDPARLMMPLDTHVYRFARRAGFTRRAAADGKTVREVTSAFRLICPEDPVKYDFSLTRPGILREKEDGSG